MGFGKWQWTIAARHVARVAVPSLCLFLGHQASGEEIQRMYRSAYHLGMGDTGVAFARAADAVYYNPAGLAQDEALVPEVSLLSPQFELSRATEAIARQFYDGNGELVTVDDAIGQQQFIAVQNYSGIVFNRAAMGIFQRAQIDAFIGTDPLTSLPRAEVGSTIYNGGHITYSRPVSQEFFLGINFKFVQKAESREEVGVLEVQELSNTDLDEYLNKAVRRGAGVGVDLGAIYRTGKRTKVAMGVTAKNIGMEYHWPVEDGVPPPKAEAAEVDLGISIEPQTRKSRSRLSLDFRDAFDERKQNIYKRVHLGAELSFQDVLGGTVGLNQGYLTYGGYVRLWILRAELGVFSEEVGAFPGARQGRRVYGRVSMGWFQ